MPAPPVWGRKLKPEQGQEEGSLFRIDWEFGLVLFQNLLGIYWESIGEFAGHLLGIYWEFAENLFEIHSFCFALLCLKFIRHWMGIGWQVTGSLLGIYLVFIQKLLGICWGYN